MTEPKKMSYKQQLRQNVKILREIFGLIVENKKWWLLPFFFVFAVLSIFLTIIGGGSVLPAIYAIF